METMSERKKWKTCSIDEPNEGTFVVFIIILRFTHIADGSCGGDVGLYD